MIVVTGSPRSGTSMWMQVLRAAGLPVIGDALPQAYRHVAEANPAGFYESRLRGGVYFATNPDPNTGVYLHPDTTREHAIKVFPHGLARTDHAFLHRVIATVRPWREQARSRELMWDLEARGLRETGAPDAALARIEKVRASRPAPVAWWSDLYTLIRDASTRGYPMHMVTYARLLADPEREIAHVLRWIGRGDLGPAAAAVRPELRTPHDVDFDGVLEEETVAMFDALYARLHTSQAFDAVFIDELNRTHQRLSTRWGLDRARRKPPALAAR